MMWGSIHTVVPGLFPFEGGSGCWIFAVPNLFPWNFHSVFIKFASFQYVPQVSNVFLNLFPIALTLCHILCSQFYSCNLSKEPKGWDYNISYLFQECSNLDSKNLCCAKQRCWSVCVYLAKYCQISTWKIWFHPIPRSFHEKMTQISQIFNKKVPDHQLFMISSAR
jgi:hypothetical protein